MANVFRNFGHEVQFEAARYIEPKSPDALIRDLAAHPDKTVRATGSRHSWNRSMVSYDTIVDVKHLDHVAVTEGNDSGEGHVTVGAGCSVDRLIEELGKKGLTLPTHGILGKQTIAGAISSATHGAGRSSMSHYVNAVTTVCFAPLSSDADSSESAPGGGSAETAGEPAPAQPVVHTWRDGNDIRAARCALGCMGIVTEVELSVEPAYFIREVTCRYDDFSEALVDNEGYPLQQFYLAPVCWKWFGQRREKIEQNTVGSPSRQNAWRYRLLRTLAVEWFMTGAIRALALFDSLRPLLRWFCRHIVPKIIGTRSEVVDQSHRILMMRHDRFRHVELELFVPARELPGAVKFLEALLRYCDDRSQEPNEATWKIIKEHSSPGEIDQLAGNYLHHYPVTFRRVCRDDALISMSANVDATGAGGEEESEDWMAISLISFHRKRARFKQLARFLARTMAGEYRARPHWGKWVPLDGEELERLYPGLRQFRAQCRRVDPEGVFRNEFIRRRLGFGGRTSNLDDE